MTKIEAIALFKETYTEVIANKKKDKPALRQAWNDFIDSLQRDEHITEKQASNWDQPTFIK